MNTQQKITILIGVVLCVLSILFPPWADYLPYTASKPFKLFAGYALLFSPPQHYQFRSSDRIKYSKDEERATKRQEERSGWIEHNKRFWDEWHERGLQDKYGFYRPHLGSPPAAQYMKGYDSLPLDLIDSLNDQWHTRCGEGIFISEQCEEGKALESLLDSLHYPDGLDTIFPISSVYDTLTVVGEHYTVPVPLKGFPVIYMEILWTQLALIVIGSSVVANLTRRKR